MNEDISSFIEAIKNCNTDSDYAYPNAIPIGHEAGRASKRYHDLALGYYLFLQNKKGLSVKKLVQKTGRSQSAIYSLLSLGRMVENNNIEGVQKFLSEGWISKLFNPIDNMPIHGSNSEISKTENTNDHPGKFDVAPSVVFQDGHRINESLRRSEEARHISLNSDNLDYPFPPFHQTFLAHELTLKRASSDMRKMESPLSSAMVDLQPHQIDAAVFPFKGPMSKGAILCDEVVIVSIPFAAKKSPEISAVSKWDLIVIDEAHRLRNVYKKDGSKQAKKLKEIFARFHKVLLTATPLQNTLMELYGLVSFIDDRFFGSEYAFKTKFMADSDGREAKNLDELKVRLSSIATRTIRRQVQEYIPYTNRISMVEDFTPTDEELVLYEQVSEYLQRDEVAAIPTKQRHLMVLIYRKILASSSFAIARTLQSLANNIKLQIEGLEPESIEELVSDVDGYEEELEEIAKKEDVEPIDDEMEENKKQVKKFTRQELQAEYDELISMKNFAESIYKNAKGDALLFAIEKAFSFGKKMGWNEKAVVFTESRRTQDYLLKLLSNNGYKDRITIFNGTNDNPIAKRAYERWEKERTRFEGEGYLSKDAVIREALIHEFKHHTNIFIATEAGAEGINLQFCNIVVNYDLPWNPQRVEQRIGRCHRYGQKDDVVVLNFMNRANAADRRVFELLDKKCRLFNGVFGASDEILGAIGSGVDFERRILEIYQSCRTEDEINNAFDRLQEELSEQINQRIVETRAKLLEHFDDEVRARFKMINQRIKEDLTAIDMMLARLIISALDIKEYEFRDGLCKLKIESVPQYVTESLHSEFREGSYYIGRYNYTLMEKRLHIGHPLAKAVIQGIKSKAPDKAPGIKLCYTKGKHKISQFQPYIGKIGFWAVYRVAFEGLDIEEHLIHIVLVDDKKEWIVLKPEYGQKFTTIMAEPMELDEKPLSLPDESYIENILSQNVEELSGKVSLRNEEYYDAELDKLETYSEEVLMRLYDELKEKENELNEARKKKQKAMTFEDRQKARKDIHRLELAYSHLADKIAQEKKRLFEEKDREMKRLEKKLHLKIQKTCIATAWWKME